MILVFSGTGNSMWVARQLAAELSDEIKTLPITDDSTTLAPDNDRVIWVFPVYSWGVPPVVRRWIKILQFVKPNLQHWCVMSCGDDCGLAAKMWEKDIQKRSWSPMSAFSVQMPNTYVLMKGFDVDSLETASEKIAKAAPRVAGIADLIARGEKVANDVVTGAFAWIKTKVIYPWFVRFAMSPEPFYATDGCVGCGECALSCPLGNIKMRERTPQWGKDCALCLRCYHVCPCHAVAYTTATRGKAQWKGMLKQVK